MKVKMILPALTEATSPFWRPIKYSLCVLCAVRAVRVAGAAEAADTGPFR